VSQPSSKASILVKLEQQTYNSMTHHHSKYQTTHIIHQHAYHVPHPHPPLLRSAALSSTYVMYLCINVTNDL